ncbi:MAG: ADP-dependent (S)-NAD(P)H-hydrate dehydratase [Rhizorhabdus sp.]|nr:ADP-dependent (S)-NAD(P)H-hydrate dehydratase [Rhizorhabdus sp.]
MSAPLPLDASWRAAHPLPVHEKGTDKNSRGRVLLAGGAEFVPGALRLTGEAALRVGAGKLQMATVRAAAMSLGVLVPEAAMIALPADQDGEIAPHAAGLLVEAMERCDTLILGPGMSLRDGTVDLVRHMIATPRPGLSIVLDAAAVSCAGDLAEAVARHEGRIVMTPHHGEMAALTGLDAEKIAADPIAVAEDAATRFRAVIVLKAGSTVIAAPGAPSLLYASDCTGLATGGSGDVLAGVIGGLIAQGAAPQVAAGWGVWVHGTAGQAAARDIGPIGFLARDLMAYLPRLLAGRDGLAR